MKDLLALTHDNMQEEELESATSTQVQQLPDQNSNEPTFNGQLSNLQNHWSAFEPVHSNGGHGQLTDSKPRLQDVQALLQELNNRRTRILIDIANEEKERQWFLAQLEKARQQQQQQKLPLTDNYGVRSDMSSRELELEVVQLREAMQRKLGSGSEILQRHEVRMQSLQLIDKEALKLQEQAQVIGNKQSFSRIEDGPPQSSEAHNGSTGSLQDLELSEFLSNCPSPPATTKSSKMTTSSTQTTIDLYPPDYPSNNAADGNGLSSIYHGTWPMDKIGLWNSGPSSFGEMNSSLLLGNQETRSVMSFTSSMNSTSSRRSHTQQLGTKVEMVYSLLSMLGSHDKDEMSKTLLDMSSSRDSCVAMRQSGCMPLLIQLLHGAEKDNGDDSRSNREARSRASKALHNIVHAHPDDKRGRREARVLRLLEQIRDYCDNLRDGAELGSDEERTTTNGANNMEQHPGPSMAALMKLSFDEEHRHAMCQLGGLQAIAELIEVDYSLHGNTSDQYCVTLRRYAGMALTNLTFGDGTNKAMLCSMKSFMTALVAQLHSPSEDLRQVVASVLRNLSWRADPASKKILREVGAVVTLMKAAMEAKKESTLKSILSALWNLSAHCSMNKADICAVDGALAFLVSTLTYKSASKTLAIIENGGGILRNISSQIAEREDYRAVLRQHNCLQILLQHLRSSSLTIVSNACGTLWNLSARSCSDQQALWEMGAVSMLRNLVHSKHKMISMGSSAALKNLLTARPNGMALAAVTSPASGDGHNKSTLPSLLVRKQRALEAEIDQNLSETCDNIDSPKSSPTHRTDTELRCAAEPHSHYPLFDRMQLLHGRVYQSANGPPVSPKHVGRSESKDSINSSHSDTSYDRLHGSPLHQPSAAYQAEQHQYPIAFPKTGGGLYNNLGHNRMSDSHITHIIHEVGRQVAAEESSNSGKSEFSSHYPMAIHFPEISTDNRLCADNNSSQTRPGSGLHNPHVYDKYSNLTNKIENLNTSEHQDNIKCSMKYGSDSEQQRERLPPKIDNYVSSNMQKEKAAQKDAVKQFPPTKQTNQQWQGINNSRSNAVYYKNSNIAEEVNVNPDAVFSTYAETDLDDLDQPTNFSLRYTEDTDNSDKFTAPVPQSHYYPASFEDKKPSVNDDAVKTYCTEGTPLNFSTASSLTDLRDLSNKEKLLLETNRDSQKMKKESSKQHETPQEISDNTDLPKLPTSKEVQNANLPDGVLSPEKPTTYCVEGTPVYFSHASSISSLHSSDVNDHPNTNQSPQRKPKEEMLEGDSCTKSDALKVKVTEDHLLYREKFARNQTNRRESVPTDNKSSHEKEGKSVSFGEGNVAEETPLMFSRCSSLGSLSSFEQHSIHDDRSSVVSDFSRRASGAVSPSDLPDSPSQTMPPSPRRTTHKMDFPPPKPTDDKTNDIFADSIQTYQLEDTPLEFSTATSLSSLAMDDDCPVASNDLMSITQTIQEEKEDTDGSKENLKMEKSEPSSKSDDSPESLDDHQDSDHQDFSEPEENDEEEDIVLAACINSAMPNNSKHNNRMYNNTKLSSKVNRFAGPPRTRSSGIPVKTNNIRVVRPPLNAATSLIPERDPQANARHNSRDKNLVSGIPNNQRSDCSLQDDDLLLKKTIDSAMPKGRPRKHNNTSNSNNLSSAQRDKSSTTKSHLVRPSAGNTSSKNVSSCLGDSVKVYAVEGTPVNFSSSSSISGLTFESTDDPAKAKETTKDKFREPPVGSCEKMLDYDDTVVTSDSFRHYAEEGTPFTISRHDSLSSLSCCTEESDHQSREREEKKRSHRDNMLYRIPGKYNAGGSSARSHSLPVMRPPVRPPAVGQASGPNPSLLRQNTLPLTTTNTLIESSDVPSSTLERHRVFQVEDTPVCFSRNSSLSSLSVESLGTETSLAEQALLDECINSAMPETKSVEKKGKSHRRKDSVTTVEKYDAKKPCSQNEKQDKPLGPQEVKSSAATRSLIPRSTVSDFVGYSEISHESDISEGYEESTVTDSSLFTDTTLCATVSNKSDTTLKAELPEEGSSVKEDNTPLQQSTVANNNSAVSDAFLSNCTAHQTEQIMMNSKLLELEASNVAVAVRKEADNIPDSMIQSAASVFSDLDNMKPPSLLGDVMSLTCSMMSSCASESVSEHKLLSESDAKGAKIIDGVGHNCPKRLGTSLSRSFEHSKLKNVPELVLRALNGNPDATKACASSEGVDSSRPPSGMGSVENLSMRSSCVSDIENIKPPSALDDIDMTCSTNSVASIMSEVAEGKSEAFSLKGSVNSEMMLECMKPVIAMVELYAREGMNAGSMKSSCNSEFIENIENINPPSIFQDFTECNSTINDVTATLGSDTDTDDELPIDNVPDLPKAALPNVDMSANPDVEEEEEPEEDGGESILDITPEEVQALEENAKLIVSTLIECKQNVSNDESSLTEDVFIECETLSLVSNESDSSQATSHHSNDASADTLVVRRPRIVKPVAGDPFRDVVRPVDVDNGPKPIRGKRRSVTKCRQPTAIPVQRQARSPARSASPKARDTPVKPTRTSALRATQSQQKVQSPPRSADCSATTSPKRASPLRTSNNTMSPLKTGRNKAATPRAVVTPMSKQNPTLQKNTVENESRITADGENCIDDNRPKPPIKQGTFTKDKPSQDSPPKISPSKIKPPSIIGRSGNEGKPPTPRTTTSSDCKENAPAPRTAAMRSRMNQSRSLDDRTTASRYASYSSRTPSLGTPSRVVNGRIQTPSPMNRKVSNSLNNLKKGQSASSIRNSPSNQSLVSNQASGRRTPNSGLSSRSGSGTLNTGKRSTSNLSLCSNNSTNTTASTVTNASSKKGQGTSPLKKEVVSKVAALWKKDNSDKSPKVGGDSSNTKVVSKNSKESTIPRPLGLSRSSTYEKLPKTDTSPERTHQPGIRLEDKNQHNNKTFTKSPSVDSKLGSFTSNDSQDNRTVASQRNDVWVKQSGTSPVEGSGSENMIANHENIHQLSPKHLPRPTTLASCGPETQECTETKTEKVLGFRHDTKSSPASAIVPPFNYTPSAARSNNQPPVKSLIPTPTKTVPAPVKRQDSYLKSIEPKSPGEPKRNTCMITTV